MADPQPVDLNAAHAWPRGISRIFTMEFNGRACIQVAVGRVKISSVHMNDAYTIRGLGLITPLGRTPGITWMALLNGQAIKDHGRCAMYDDSTNDMPIVPDDSASFDRGRVIPRVSLLAVFAARQAIDDAGWKPSQISDPRTAMVVATSRGPADAWLEQADRSIEDAQCTAPAAPPLETATSDNPIGRNRPSLPAAGQSNHPCSWFAQAELTPWDHGHEIGIHQVSSDVARALSWGSGPRWCISAACASGLHAVARAILALKSGEADRVLVVAAESSLHPLFLRSFSRLGVFPPEGEICRPFDQHRHGFLMSESAAAICIERTEQPRQGDLLITHAQIASDATHLTAIDPAGRTMDHLLSAVTQGYSSNERQPAGRSIPDLIHAHGTGTLVNDPIELAAISRCALGSGRQPVVYSHKGAIGHTLGAAGLIAVVINAMVHRHGIIPPNINTTCPLPAPGLILQTQGLERTVQSSLCLAAGFGGSAGIVRLDSYL